MASGGKPSSLLLSGTSVFNSPLPEMRNNTEVSRVISEETAGMGGGILNEGPIGPRSGRR